MDRSRVMRLSTKLLGFQAPMFVNGKTVDAVVTGVSMDPPSMVLRNGGRERLHLTVTIEADALEALERATA